MISEESYVNFPRPCDASDRRPRVTMVTMIKMVTRKPRLYQAVRGRTRPYKELWVKRFSDFRDKISDQFKMG